MIEKLIRWLDNWTDRILLLAFLIVICTGIYIISDSNYVYTNSSATKILPKQARVQAAEEEMKEMTEDVTGWIILEDTPINYPIMHANDNEKYLNMDPYGEYNIAGSIFLDSRNSGDFSDHYSIIYGHHMSHKMMFGALDDFESEEYFYEHRTGTLICNGVEYPLNVFGFSIMDALDENIFDPDYYDGDIYDYIDWKYKVNQNHGNGNILALSTCRDPGMTVRTVVFCEVLDPVPTQEETDTSD